MPTSTRARLAALLCLLLASLCLAAPVTQPLDSPMPLDEQAMLKAAATVTHQAFPEADTALVDDNVLTIYQQDGTSVTWDDMAYKVLTEKGRKSLQTLSLYYCASYGKAQFRFITLHKADGSRVELPIDKLTREMVEPSQMQSNIYNPNDKVIVANVPGLDVGDTIRYCVRRETFKPRCPNTFSDIHLLESDELIVRYSIVVDGPAELPLRHIAVRDPVGQTVRHSLDPSAPGRIRHRWTIANVPVIHREPKMPPLSRVAQRLMLSTIDSWKDVSAWYWRLCQPHLKPSPEMKAKVAELTRGLTDQHNIIRAIFTFVSQEIRYMGITIEDDAPGYEPHDVALTFAKRHGVCRDKAALLVAMLNLAGQQAFPVLIHAGNKMDQEVIQPYFNHAITAALAPDGSYILMDPTDENTRDLLPSYLADKSFLVAREQGDTLRTTPFSPASDNLLDITTTATIDERGNLDAKATLAFAGIHDNAYRGFFANAAPEDRRSFVERVIRNIAPGAVLSRLDITPANLLDTATPLRLDVAFTAEAILTQNSTNALLAPPFLSSTFGMNNFILGSTQLDQRKYPFLSKYACAIREALKLTLHPTWKTPATLPDYQTVHDERLDWSRTAKADGQTLDFLTRFDLNAIEFSPQQYLTLKEQLRQLEDNARKRVILDRANTPQPTTDATAGADAEILEHTIAFNLQDAYSWTQTDYSKTRILTYKGKKENAEVSIDFNPAWETVHVDLAKVSTPDGKGGTRTQTVSPQEINLMDAEWVAAAPRYPASRRLVVSLPGVEIGSVIELKVTSTCKNGPAFSLQHAFRRHSAPVRHMAVSVNTPTQLKLSTAVHQNGIFASSAGAHQSNIAETFASENGRTIWTWTADSQPAIPDEPYQPPTIAFAPAILISATSWQQHLARLSQAIAQRCVAGPRIREAATAIRKLPLNQRLAAVNTFLDKAIANAGPSFLELPLDRLSEPETTLADGYGHDADQAIAAFTLLRELDFNPEFVFAANAPLQHDLLQQQLACPSPYLFAKLLVRVVHDSKTHWLNDQSQYANLQTCSRDRCPAMTADARLFTIDTPSPFREQSSTTFSIAIDDHGDATLTFTDTIHGPRFAAENRRFAELTPEYRRRHFLALVSQFSKRAVPSSELVTDFSSYPARLSFSCRIPKFAVIDGPFCYFTIPNAAFRSLPLRFDHQRSTPIAHTRHTELTSTFTITLPPSRRTVTMAPQNWNWLSPDGKSRYAIRTTQPSPDTLVCTMTASQAPDVAFPGHLDKYRLLADTLTRNDSRTFLLKK